MSANLILDLVCHREPARSLMLDGQLLPLCARCTGFYAGLVLAFAVVAWRAWWAPRGAALWLLAATLMVNSSTLVWEALDTNAYRLWAGVVLGVWCGWTAATAMRGSHAARMVRAPTPSLHASTIAPKPAGSSVRERSAKADEP
mgnify:CR=1 FL=1